MGMEKREPSCTVFWTVNWYGHYGEKYRGSLKKLSYDPTIPLVGICLEKLMIQKDTCAPLFIVVLFTITSTWKQPKLYQQMNR